MDEYNVIKTTSEINALHNFKLLKSYIDEFSSISDSLYCFGAKLSRPRLFLYLHKYSIPELKQNSFLFEKELKIIHTEVAKATSKVLEVYPYFTKNALISLAECELKILNEQEAFFFHEHAHYLLSKRKGIVHLGLFSKDNKIIGLVTFSQNDLSQLDDSLPLGIKSNEAVVLSRLIIFDNAPFNSGTFILAKAKQWLRSNLPEIKLILTYMDPNLGYKGTIYKASNWIFWAEEKKRRYLYIDDSYVTDREAINRFDTADISKIKNTGITGISESKFTLLPLQIYCWFINIKHANSLLENKVSVEPLKTLIG